MNILKKIFSKKETINNPIPDAVRHKMMLAHKERKPIEVFVDKKRYGSETIKGESVWHAARLITGKNNQDSKTKSVSGMLSLMANGNKPNGCPLWGIRGARFIVTN